MLSKKKKKKSSRAGRLGWMEYARSDEVHFFILFGEGRRGGGNITPATNRKGKPGEEILRRNCYQFSIQKQRLK